MKSISVLLVDDSPTFLRIARRFLEQYEDIAVVDAVRDGEAALARARELRPQVVLLDLAMPGLSGLEAIPLLRQALPEVGIIAVTLLGTGGYREAALAAGADGFVPKTDLSTDLLPVIRRVAKAPQA